MKEKASFGLKLRYDGGEAAKHRLEAYDGTTSFHGFSQALQIATHAYVNNEIVSRATALKGGKVFLKAPRHGSFLLELVVFIETYPAVAGIAAPVFYDFLKYTFGKATGKVDQTPDTPAISKLSTKDEPFFDDLAETLEGSLQRAHRAIDQGVKDIHLERPRSKLVKFDKRTSAWVNTRDENPNAEELNGNVTRYNSVTGNGRVFVRELQRIVPFRPDPQFNPVKRGLLTWSLHGSTTDRGKQLKLTARKIESARGEVKRIILTDCDQADTE